MGTEYTYSLPFASACAYHAHIASARHRGLSIVLSLHTTFRHHSYPVDLVSLQYYLLKHPPPIHNPKKETRQKTTTCTRYDIYDIYDIVMLAHCQISSTTWRIR